MHTTKINFSILFILILLLLIFFIFFLLLVTDYSTTSLFFVKNLNLITIFALLGFVFLLLQFCRYCPVVSFHYSTIHFHFNVLFCSVIVFLLVAFIVLVNRVGGVFFQMEEIIVVVGFLFISLFAISSQDFISLFVCLEGLNLCLLILLLTRTNDLRTSEATIKYALISMLSALIFLNGSLLVYINFGVLSFEDLALLLRYSSVLNNQNQVLLGYLGIYLVLISFCIKLGIFPFYSWIINVYRALQVRGLIFAVVLSKTITLLLFINILYFVSNVPAIFIFLYSLGVGSLFISTLRLFFTTNVREFIAYMSLNSTGFLLLFLTLDNDYTFLVAIIYVIIQAFNYIFMFSFLMFFKTKTLIPLDFKQLRNYAEINFVYFSAFCFTLFSLIGIPPFAGFFPKVLMMFLLFQEGGLLVFFSFIIFATLSSFFFIRILKFFSVNSFKVRQDKDTVGYLVPEQSPLYLIRSFRLMNRLIVVFFVYNLFIFTMIIFILKTLLGYV